MTWGAAWGDSTGGGVDVVAQKEATFELVDRGTFEVTVREYTFKGQYVQPLELGQVDTEIHIDPDQKSFYV